MKKLWTTAERFMCDVDRRKTAITVVGLGYVGLPLALTFADKGFKTYGYDNDTEKIAKLKTGVNYIIEEEWLGPFIRKHIGRNFVPSGSIDNEYNVAIIAVPTPYDRTNKRPVYDYVIEAGIDVGRTIKPESLAVLESTVGLGTTEGLLKNILEKESGLKAGVDFGLAFSPERINPGDKEHRIYNIPKVVGGYDKLSTVLTSYLYEKIVPYIRSVNNLAEAEMVKLIENTFRDINIAAANMLARICDEKGIDVKDIIEAASTKWNFVLYYPGCGVGGHCIPDDPYFLLDTIDERNASLIVDARRINESMPIYTADKLIAALFDKGKSLNAKVTLLGLSYKGNVSDTRSTPTKDIADYLRKVGMNPVAHDPFVDKVQWIETMPFDSAVKGADGIVLCTDHEIYRDIPYRLKELASGSVFVDGRNMFNREDFEPEIKYIGIGRR